MGYHPKTLVFSFPPYPKSERRLGAESQPWNFGQFLYRLSPWIGFDIWHIDPEKKVPGRRRDDSCGWFPRDLTPELERAVQEILGSGHSDLMDRVKDAFATAYLPNANYPSLIEMPMHVALSTHLMVLQMIDRLAFRRWERPWWRRSKTPQLLLIEIASQMAFSTIDNLNGAYNDPERYIRLLAAVYRRRLRPWWRHPRWHVQIRLYHNIRRMFKRCDGCKRRLGFGHSPLIAGSCTYHNSGCADAAK